MSQHEVDERSNLINNNRFELLLFRLGESQRSDQREQSEHEQVRDELHTTPAQEA